MRKASRETRKSSQLVKKRYDRLGDSLIIILFLVLVLFIISFFGSKGSSELSVEQEQKILLSKLVVQDEREDGPAIVIGNNVDDARLKELASRDYSEIKHLVGITSEFVIYFEDEQGNLINVIDRPCIGSSYAQVNGVLCNP